MSTTILLQPRISEKSYAQSATGVYVFDVPVETNKHSIKAAVEAQYKVSVTDVRTTVIKGKPKHSVRKRQRPIIGKRTDIKKAYVTLKKGDKIATLSEEAK